MSADESRDVFSSAEQETEIRRRLFAIAAETIFSRRRVSGDPLTGTHVIATFFTEAFAIVRLFLPVRFWMPSSPA